jgi:hypothetical protein
MKRIGFIIIPAGTLVTFGWPVIAGFALPAAFLYGCWIAARVIKHKSLDFGDNR